MTIILDPEVEARFREEAAREGLPVGEWLERSLRERELLWRIRTAAPEPETRELHRLIRRRDAGRITGAEQERLQEILDARELRGAERLNDLVLLSRLRGTPVPELMNQLGVHPIPTP